MRQKSDRPRQDRVIAVRTPAAEQTEGDDADGGDRAPGPHSSESSHQVHGLSLRLSVRLNVALGRAQSGMPRQHLHVSEVIIASC